MADDGVWSEPLSQSEFPIPLQSEAVPSHGGCGRAAAATLPADWPHGGWRAPRKNSRIAVECVTRRRRTNEREPVQRRTNHWDFARGGGRAENRRSMSPARDRRSDTVQVESQVWRYGSGRRQAA